ncbi:putative outer membrane lipoprotein [Kitasatospora sp. GAS204A]|nr:hypothetical protein [Kitasatospora sp. GAS204B]MDH6116851.1 putative outer membrane lipoprotein [Kitasatospora sp. GAS204B]
MIFALICLAACVLVTGVCCRALLAAARCVATALGLTLTNDRKGDPR